MLIFVVRLLIGSLLHFLQWIDTLAQFNLEFSYTSLLFPLALLLAMGMLIFLPLKTFFPAAFIIGAAAIFPAYPRLKLGDARIDVLDVGQGLAVVVTTAQHVLVYDTGMKFYKGGDMGQLAIITYLKTLGLKKIDKVVISHPDLDHRGGLVSLEEKYPVDELLVDKPQFYKRGKSCHYHKAWRWDGVSFRFFSIHKDFQDKNNNSCVLRVSNRSGSLLLTGDIEKKAEEFLVKHYGNHLQSTVLLVPHHGSKTSTSSEFLNQVKPKEAIISFGFDNRYHFPHTQTLTILAAHQIKVYDTVSCGMVTVELLNQEKNMSTFCYRKKENKGVFF